MFSRTLRGAEGFPQRPHFNGNLSKHSLHGHAQYLVAVPCVLTVLFVLPKTPSWPQLIPHTTPATVPTTDPRLRPSPRQSVLILLYRLMAVPSRMKIIKSSVGQIIFDVPTWIVYSIRLPLTEAPINFKSIPIQSIFQLLQQGMKLMPCEVPPAIDERVTRKGNFNPCARKAICSAIVVPCVRHHVLHMRTPRKRKPSSLLERLNIKGHVLFLRKPTIVIGLHHCLLLRTNEMLKPCTTFLRTQQSNP